MRWANVARMVLKLHKRIDRAAQRGATTPVRRLQTFRWRSRAATRFAVRQVTQDNRGQGTAGVDGHTAFTPAGRLALVAELKRDGQAPPVRRVMIPHPRGSDRRPLGLPTIADRAKPRVVKLAREPAGEATVEPHSSGFRPGRRPWDAIGALSVQLNQTPQGVLEADIAKGVDRIDHAALVRTLDAHPPVPRHVNAWLQAGMMAAGERFPPEAGVPHGGPRSPLLANVARHGLEEMIGQAWPRRGLPPAVIRDAEDRVVRPPEREVIEQRQALMAPW
jgi:RNA-directed DNA polymerase